MPGADDIGDLEALLEAAVHRRSELLAVLQSDGTDCWRQFHGTAEGWPGLTIDRYGDRILIQTFRGPLEPDMPDRIEALLGQTCVWRARGDAPTEPYSPPEWARTPHAFRELGTRSLAPLVHRGMDPWLFLDFRSGRRWIRANAGARSVLNTFAYTGGAGLAAAAGGAASVTQLDHGGWCLTAAAELAKLNGHEGVEHIRADFFVALRQFAGLKITGRAARRGYPRLPQRRFDLVVLDPPTLTRGPFGAVDIQRDYAALAKPCLLSLNDGGALLATHHSAATDMDAWLRQVQRCAHKAGRPIRHVEVLPVDADFPSFDGASPMKVAVFTV